MPCRIMRRREWNTKLMLEWLTWKCGVFVTLTYAPEHLPSAEFFPGGELVKKDLQKFIKRFRFNYEQKDIRYFAVGEYGSTTHRAHYHLVIFNVRPEKAEQMIKKSWTLGHSMVADLAEYNEKRLAYVLGYTIKKLTSEKDFPDNRLPEFTLMSRKPPLGSYALEPIAQRLREKNVYPSKSLTMYEEWVYHNSGLEMQRWNGLFKMKGKTYQFDRNMMKRLADLAHPTIKSSLASDEPLLKSKAQRVHENALHDISYLDTMSFLSSEEFIDEKKKAKKFERQFYKNGVSQKV